MSGKSESKKDFLHRLKMESAAEIGRLDFVKENNHSDKGDLSSRQNGSEGGPIGGQMVKKMLAYAQQQMEQSGGHL